jgi:transketolase
MGSNRVRNRTDQDRTSTYNCDMNKIFAEDTALRATEPALSTEPADFDMGFIRELAQQLRVDSIRASTAAGSGHPTSSMSAAGLMAVLLARHFRYDWRRPDHPGNDRLIFSKGHASPLLYSMFKAVGVINDDELLTFRQLGSRLQGHPTPVLPWVDVATGSLGQGLPIAVGMALVGKYLDKLPFHVWVLCGDSELTEGSIWEGLDKAAYYHLSNLTVIVDVNRLGQRGETEFGWNMEPYRQRVEAFGCQALEVSGHDLLEIDPSLALARAEMSRPTVILAKTVKGKGVHELENREGWHGKALPAEMAERAIAELGGRRDLHVETALPESAPPRKINTQPTVALPTYALGARVATRKAYGESLKALGSLPRVIGLDAEVSNSTYAQDFAQAYPERFFEMFIAEQQLVATAVGLSARGYIPFASTFAAFMSRAYDFIRMAAVSRANIRLVGSHAGVEIGPDGPSQMALEDLAMFRAIPESTVLYPSDAVSTAQLVKLMAETSGVIYLRTTRGAYPVIYRNDERFAIGGSKTLRSSPDDRVALVGAGVTLHHCLAAADQLAGRGIGARVIDLYSIKPVDVGSLREASRVTGGRFVVAEDHYPEGGLGSAVMEALASDPTPPRVEQCAVRTLPGSGAPADTMEAAGITPAHIVAAAERLLESVTQSQVSLMASSRADRSGQAGDKAMDTQKTPSRTS